MIRTARVCLSTQPFTFLLAPALSAVAANIAETSMTRAMTTPAFSETRDFFLCTGDLHRHMRGVSPPVWKMVGRTPHGLKHIREDSPGQVGPRTYAGTFASSARRGFVGSIRTPGPMVELITNVLM